MTTKSSSSKLAASAIALATGLSVTPAFADSYMAGDFHNHTTCNDGSTSVQTMLTASLNTFGLEWLGDSGHGGSFTRDCRFDDPEGDASKTGSGALFEDTVHSWGFKGDPITSTSNSPDGLPHRAMYEWQIMQDYHYSEMVATAKLWGNTMTYMATEQNVPGHEHASTAVIAGQVTWGKGNKIGDVYAGAEYEYRFDRNDSDMSGGAPDHRWQNKIANASGPTTGVLNHKDKAIPGVKWMQKFYPLESYFVPAHVERAGVFDPTNNRGWNVEHFRDFNNAGPTVAFGFETQPGHQASNTPGEYQKDFGGPGIDSVGVSTRGGTGIYGAKIGGLWDAMLGEGRNWFFFASSDFHNRGAFSPFVRESTQDFYPGEYQKTYILRPTGYTLPRPQTVVNELRTGNSFAVMGDLITGELTYQASSKGEGKAKMGETLVVPRGSDVKVTLTVNLPTGPNHSPYSFDNPSLLQVGINQPLNMPVLDHVDFIGGNITGLTRPGTAAYKNDENPSTRILGTFDKTTWKEDGQSRTMTFTIKNVKNSQYVRIRGTNLPVGTPHETDAQGNPLKDAPKSKIPCNDAACPDHMQTSANGKRKFSSFDVARWSDLWFYTNPIFIRVEGEPELLVEKNADLAKKLRQAQKND